MRVGSELNHCTLFGADGLLEGGFKVLCSRDQEAVQAVRFCERHEVWVF